MSVPNAEIEAAAIALCRNHRNTPWAYVSRPRQEEFLADARDALEAAASVRANRPVSTSQPEAER